ncbi:MAG: guanylate kinase [Candidatus Makaraimicrobium thalassicum]|nr:MAG: guanylate kinase [Candidatus Omnitrophota bacterium]
MKTEPLIIVLSAPSGSGKTTLITRLLENVPRIKRSISYTTRQPREGETDKQDYIFVSREEFRERIENGKFLEWEENFGNYYGTSREQIQEALEEGTDIILSIDVKGARTVKKDFPGSISVFIMPPSVEELATRLKKRNTDQKKQVSLRLKESRAEIASADEYDYLIVNENLEKAAEELRTIVETERDRRKDNIK